MSDDDAEFLYEIQERKRMDALEQQQEQQKDSDENE